MFKKSSILQRLSKSTKIIDFYRNFNYCMKVMFRKYGNVFKNDMVVLNVEGGYELREGYSFIVPSFDI